MWWAALLGAIAVVSFAACSERSADPPATPTAAATVAPTPTAEQAPPAGDPGVTVENAVLACREKDGDRLRSLVAGPVTEAELEALFDRGTLERLASRTEPNVEDGRATVDVRLLVRREGETELLERTWELERGADGVWRFATLPDCY